MRKTWTGFLRTAARGAVGGMAGAIFAVMVLGTVHYFSVGQYAVLRGEVADLPPGTIVGVMAFGAVAGLLLAIFRGKVEIRGRAKRVIQGGLYGATVPLVIGVLRVLSVPGEHAAGVLWIVCALIGALIGGMAGYAIGHRE
ncbi:MAG: hypothetical protein HQ581_24705 [Planctomycetes bacterium]|nr:hypothetical protein [Planctomycetota bacterium]